MRRKFNILFLFLMVTLTAYSAPEVTFNVIGKNVIALTPERSTGLNKIYVAESVQGLVITAPTYNGKPLSNWQQYDNRGGGYATEVENLQYEGTSTILSNPQGDTGYILTWPDATFYFWLTDYSRHPLQLEAIELPLQEDCGMVSLTLTGTGDAIHYYSINGRQLTLNRDIVIDYFTLEWNNDTKEYRQITDSTLVQSVGSVFISPAPLCNTTFRASGDRFLTAWGRQQEVRSNTWHTNAVEVHTGAERINAPSENSNQIGASQDAGNLGGSAPADIAFRAYVSDAVIHNEWQFATDSKFENITHRFNERDLDYTFLEEGETYVRFVGSNSNGSCTTEGEVYTVQIGASDLRCPNAFSPGASEGVNDEWKVSYRSLVEFKCWIFDRYGTQMFYFEDPEQGWDGKYQGKLVRPGVYFYVIEAKGADGRKYKKGGDINILRYNPHGTSGGGSGYSD